jgi:hypothetical protein
MAISMNMTSSSEMELKDFLELVDKSHKTMTEEALLEHAEHLQMLSNNRRFLVDLIIRELKNIYDFQPRNNYTAQTLMLGGVSNKFYVRANIWLPARLLHPVNYQSEKRLYSFERAHDHNFDFLTVGYLGGGYETEIYEYDGQCNGEPGEQIDLKFLERTSLPQHKVMLYRASRDVHIQKLPKDDFSISINLLSPPVCGREQYIFDLDGSVISSVLRADHIGQCWLIEAAGHLCDDNIADVLADIAIRHSSSKTRAAAKKALEVRWPGAISSLG